MKKTVVLVSALALLTAACQQEQTANRNPRSATASTVAPEDRTQATAAAGESGTPALAPDGVVADTASPTTPATPPSMPRLAMDFRYALALPSAQVRPMMDSHQEACERAGPAQCQVTGFSSRDNEEGLTTGELTLRATPAWLRLFRARVEGDVRDARGRILNAGTAGEDVAPVIQEAQASTQSLSEQRAALVRSLRTGADDPDVLRGQIADLDLRLAQTRAAATEAEARATMAAVRLEYRANALVPASGDGAPVAEAMRNFWSVSAQVTAVLIYLLSFALPFALVIAPIAWLVMRNRRRPAQPTP